MSDHVGSGPHGGHDLDLIAAASAGDLSEAEMARADALTRSCAECASIVADLRLVAEATRSLGSAFNGTAAPAPRDYRITESEAARLSRGGIVGSGFTLARQVWFHRLGTGLVALGLIALLVSAAPLSFLEASGAASTGAQSERLNGMAASAAPAQPALLPSSGVVAKATDAPAPALDFAATPTATSGGGSTALAIVGASGLLLGIVLLLAARTPRRAGP